MKRFYLFLFTVVLFVAQPGLAQSFLTRVSAETIGKKDVVQVEYTAENAKMTDFIVPRFNNWQVVSGPNFSSNSIQSGKYVRQQITYSLGLLPKATGKLLVPGAVANIDDRQQKSNEVFVTVKKVDHVAGAAPAAPSMPQMNLLDKLDFPQEQYGNDQFLKKGENAREKIKDNILVLLEVSKKSSYVGEPILVTYKLCSRLRSQSRVIKQPTFSGATVIEMTMNDPLPTRETINGKPYNVYVIRKVQLFPLKEGTITLPVATVENKVSFYSARGNNYRDLFYDDRNIPVEDVTLNLENKPTTIDVKPLPASPEGFSGGVGNFDISVSVSSPNKVLETNSTQNLSIAILGEGNLQQVKAPQIQWPAGIEAFDAKEAEQGDEEFFPLRIRKEFTIPFVVNKKGDYTIPSIRFIYFNQKENKYVAKTTPPIALHVLQGKATPTAVVTSKSGDEFQLRLYILLGLIFVSVVAGSLWYNKRQKSKPPGERPPVAPEEKTEIETVNPTQYLFQIRELQPMDNEALFYKNVCKNVHGYIESKFSIKPEQISSITPETQGEQQALEKLQRLLDICKQGMYTPLYNLEEAMQHRLFAIEVLTDLERQSFETVERS